MQNDEIERQILQYLDDGFQDSDYVATIVTALPLPQIYDLICQLLKSDDYEAFSMTGLFLRDTILMGSRNPQCIPFCEAYAESEIVKTLEELLFADNHFIRTEVIYTLGRTCSYGSGAALSRAFEVYRDSDPLSIGRLIGEMRWLGVKNIDRCIYSMVTNSSYLTRWAAVESVSSIFDNSLGNRVLQYPDILRRDECELIRLEAEYEYQRIIKNLQSPILSKVEQRQRAKAIKKIQPAISFQAISGRFRNYLWNNGSSQYQVADFDRFVELFRDECCSAQK